MKKRKRKRIGRSALGSRRRKRFVDEDSAENELERVKILRGRENEEAIPETPSRSELLGDVREGQVVSIRGSEAHVVPEEGDPVRCILRKSTRVPHPRASALVVGDRVRFLIDESPPYVLTEVRPRTSALARSRRGREEHVICSNVDLGVIVASAREPRFKARLVDRYLISLKQGGLKPVLVLNKIDLAQPEDAGRYLAPYRMLGIPSFVTSARTGEGLESLAEALAGHTSVFSGQSGVGKTMILNRLIPGLELRTKEVYGKEGKGRHTTSTSTLYRFPFGGAVVDTPGIRSFLLHAPSREVLTEFFPEILEAAQGCRFGDCSHHGDEGCALPSAIEAGDVEPERLESFVALQEEVRRSGN